MSEKEHQVFLLIKSIPPGMVMTYGQIARIVGLKNPRHVGRILHSNPSQETYPCHRVVRADGTVASGFAFGGPGKQLELLQVEGVPLEKRKIDLSIAQWYPTS